MNGLFRFPVVLAVALIAGACATVQPAPSPLPSSSAPGDYDVLITNARIVDGTGNPWYRGAVATRGDRIAYVGLQVAGLRAKQVIDAKDMVVSPGFIDMLGHSESAILVRPQAVSKITQGITSEVTGEVHSAWPNWDLGSNPPAGEWRSLGEFLDRLDRQGAAINLGTYVGTSSVRRAVMGPVATRNPTAGEMAQMGALIDSAMRGGAMGVGTGLIYLPSTYFTTEELIGLTRYAAKYRGGYATHMRSEGSGLIEAVRETIRIARESGTWAQIRHIKSRYPAQMAHALALIDSARRDGIDITADQYPYIASGTGLAAMLNTWVQEGGRDSMVARLKRPEIRARLKRELAADSAAGIRTSATTMVNQTTEDSLKKYQGMRLADIGRMTGRDAWDAAFDILVADGGRTSAIYFSFNEEALRNAMRQPWVSVGQDAGARSPDSTGKWGERGHPRAFGTFPRILGKYVREEGVITLEFAIRKMTSLAAQRVGLADRGLLRPGMFADITIFDQGRIIDKATFESPQQTSEGVHFVMVNGRLVLENGKPTGALPGRSLRGPGFRR